MAKALRVVYFKTDGSYPKWMDVKDDIDTFHELIHCDTIDIPRRYIDGKSYRIICDDCGLLKLNPKISVYSMKSVQFPIVGNVLVAGMEDNEGELTDLTDEDITRITCRKHTVLVDGRWVLMVD